MPRFENHPSALIARPVPVQLVVETGITENGFQLLQLLLRKFIALGLGPRFFAGINTGVDIRIQVPLVAAALVFLDARLPLQLAVQQVDFLVIAAGFFVFDDQLDQTCLGCALDPLDHAGFVPFVAAAP